MKNSSRLVAEIERNRSRSSSGWLAFADSSNTLRLNSSHDNSRLMNRSGEDNKGGGSSFAAATAVDDECCFFVATAGAKRSLRFPSRNIDPIPARRKRAGAPCSRPQAGGERVDASKLGREEYITSHSSCFASAARPMSRAKLNGVLTR